MTNCTYSAGAKLTTGKRFISVIIISQRAGRTYVINTAESVKPPITTDIARCQTCAMAAFPRLISRVEVIGILCDKKREVVGNDDICEEYRPRKD